MASPLGAGHDNYLNRGAQFRRRDYRRLCASRLPAPTDRAPRALIAPDLVEALRVLGQTEQALALMEDHHAAAQDRPAEVSADERLDAA